MKKAFIFLFAAAAMTLACDPVEKTPVVEAGNFTENLNEGYITYYGETYNVVKMKDGKWWMAENLRYVPDGMVPSKDLDNVTAGIYYPVVLNADNTAAEQSDAVEDIKANGYLYQSEVALGLKVGALTTVAAAEALEGAQGICPEGWHIPTADDIIGLVGKAVPPLETNTAAPYYDASKSNSSIEKLNADGFNASAWGAISIANNTTTSATLMGWLKTMPDAISSGFVCGSTYAGVTYNEANDETSGVKNLQFYGFMPMLSLGSFNGSKLSYRIGASVRCVRDAE